MFPLPIISGYTLVVTVFFGLMRVSEFTCSNNFDPEINLSFQDISFNDSNSIMYVRIKASKTDPFRFGCIIRLAAIPGHALCPLAIMKRYLEIRGPRSGPLFLFSDGRFVTRNYVLAFIRITLPNSDNVNTHSFRIGGASAALSAGASDSLIRVMGRWSSDCYNRYIRISDQQVKRFQTDISAGHTTRIWDGDS